MNIVNVHHHQTRPSRLLLVPKNKIRNNSSSRNYCSTFNNNETTTSEEDPEDPSSSSSSAAAAAQTRLDLLDQLTSSSNTSSSSSSTQSRVSVTTRPTSSSIRQQLALLGIDRDSEEFSIPLGKNLKKVSPKFLTTSQKRNIKRQSYLNEVSKRNDSAFFATVGAFVILPPLGILAYAVATGYVQLFP